MVDEPIQRGPDIFDRMLGQLRDLPDVVRIKEAIVRHVPPFGVGVQTYTVQTIRQREKGDTIFLESMSANGVVRLVIPPKVADLIARQRQSLTKKTRSKVARERAEDLKARGIKPGFLRKRAEKGGSK